MPFVRPTLDELKARARASVASELKISGLAPKTVLRGLAHAVAGVGHGQHGHLEHLALRQFPQSATVEEGVLYWADLRGITRLPADYASGDAVVSGQVGAFLPAQSQLVRSDQILFATRNALTIPGGGSASVPVRALTAGLIGNTDPAATLKLAAAVPGIAVDAVVASGGLNGGVDAESFEDLRRRVLRIWRNPARGGTREDWVNWTLEVPIVTRAWCTEGGLGPGTVLVLFAVDGQGYGPIPSTQDVTTVRTHLETRRPLGADLFVIAPIAQLLSPTIHVEPDTPEVRAAVEANIEDLLQREAEPGGVLRLSRLREAVSLSAGEENSTIYAPTSDVVSPSGSLLVLGTVNYI